MSWAAKLEAVDRAVLAEFGGPVGYQPASGPAASIVGLFDAAYVRVEAGQAGVSSVGPAVFLVLADLPSDPEDDPAPIVTVTGVDYQVREVEKDGQGGVTLHLYRA